MGTESNPFANVAGGRFRPLGRLGTGGQGVVYLCDDATRGHRVAVKLAALATGSPPEASFLFREAHVASRLVHPALTRVLDSGAEPHLVWMSMEHVVGRTWAQSMLDPHWTFRARVAAGATVAEALGLLHGGGVIHADVKPSNIILDRAGQARVIDLGLASIPGRIQGPAVGTPAYASPEVLLHGFRDARADIFGLGVTLFEVFTGRHPWFEGQLDVSTIGALICRHPPQSLAAVRPLRAVACTTVQWFRLAGVLARAYAPDPTRRWPTMGDFGCALADVLRV